ncbi:MAG TPA: hypothetical protein VK084_09630 [Chitinophagaceae bacterium]|nr:hypothetical protein [Chitinophagaceae bacterium]
MKKKLLFILLLLFSSYPSFAQEEGYVMQHIALDSVVITASKYGFDIAGFIQRVEQDTTFYKAFKTLRILSYKAKNNIRIFNENGSEKASFKSTTLQHHQHGCRTMDVLSEKTTGNFYKSDSSYNYYTAKLYADVFFTRGKICGETNIVGNSYQPEKANNALDRHKNQLKQLIFNPGKPIHDIPLISNKVAIFSNDIAPHYNFSIHSASYDSTDCYVFTAKVKPAYKEKMVIDHLTTFFSKKKMEIIYRDYTLSYKNFLFHFNVNMQVSMTHFDGLMVPKRVYYNGNWKILFKKAENVIFLARFAQFTHDG